MRFADGAETQQSVLELFRDFDVRVVVSFVCLRSFSLLYVTNYFRESYRLTQMTLSTIIIQNRSLCKLKILLHDAVKA